MNKVSVREIREMFGARIVSLVGAEYGSSEMTFHADDGKQYRFYHEHDCCESVLIEDICGDVNDFNDCVIVSAEQISYSDDEIKRIDDAKFSEGGWSPESWTWTFYRFISNKGVMTVRWLGESNGYYSESVSYSEYHEDDE